MINYICSSSLTLYYLNRHFNRKYPIQLIIKDNKVPTTGDEDFVEIKPIKRRFSRHRSKHEKSEIREVSESSPKLNETEAQTQESGGEMDFGATILNADVNC